MARDRGSGSVSFNASKKLWIGTIEVGWTARGTRRRVSVSAKTKRDALTKLKAKQREILKGGLPAEGVGRAVTIKKYADAWLARREVEVRPSTFNADRWATQKYIIPAIGRRRLEQVTAHDVRKVIQAVEDAGLGATSAVRCHTALQTLLKAALVDGHTVPAGALLVSPPELGESSRDEIPLEHAITILRSLRGNPQRLRWYLAFLAGVRPAEARGLTEAAFDLDNHTIDVSWQIKELPLRVKGDSSSGYKSKKGDEVRQIVGAWHLTRPKTTAGKRIIPMVPWVEDAYREWLTIRPESPYGLVFPRASTSPRYVGHPVRDGWDREAWYLLLDDLGIKKKGGGQYVPYEMRHTCASLLARLGVSDHIITMILGHATIISTKAYIHVGQAEAMEALTGVGHRLKLTASSSPPKPAPESADTPQQ